MTEQERGQVAALLGKIKFHWGPQPGPQTQAIRSEATELLYGGAAGGGKTDLALGLAYLGGFKNALIVRRTFPQLEGNIIPRSREMFGGALRYHEQKHVWDRGKGRRIMFRPYESYKEHINFQGAEYDYIAPDELTQFTEQQYLYLVSRLRRANEAGGTRARIVAPTNPGGEGHVWVKRRWAPWLDKKHPNTAMPGELRWFAQVWSEDAGKRVDTEVGGPDPFLDAGEVLYPMSRTFIPARLEDNAYLGDEYRARLQSLPEPLRSQLLYGDWSAGEEDPPNQVIPTAWVEAAMARWCADGGGAPLSVLGADISRGGRDATVFAPRHGRWFGKLHKHSGAITKTGDGVIDLAEPLLVRGGVLCIDVISVGASPYDAAVRRGLRVYACNFGAGSDGVDKSGLLSFANVRAEYWWRMREALDPETGNGLALPPDPELLGDLTAPRRVPCGGVIKIESKDEVKKRLGRSPDCGDAVVMANGLDVASVDGLICGGRRGAARGF